MSSELSARELNASSVTLLEEDSLEGYIWLHLDFDTCTLPFVDFVCCNKTELWVEQHAEFYESS